jgi:glyoxylate carboligase
MSRAQCMQPKDMPGLQARQACALQPQARCNQPHYRHCRCNDRFHTLVCITGQVASPLLGTDAFQESDVLGISMPITKWNYQVTTPEEIPEAIAQAFYIAQTGRPGPVLIDITKDAQFGELEFEL